jgi:hypothetical protein
MRHFAPLVLIALLVVVAAGSIAPAAHAAADVQITALDCVGHPRKIRIENLGDQAVSLSGWQLQSDPAEGGPFDLGQAGSLAAGQKIYVFNGHPVQNPPQNPALGFYRWGVDATFFLRANDSNDYVRIVDNQGNTVDERHCEGVPGGTPDPAYEAQFATATPTPVVTPTPTAAPTSNRPTATTAPRGQGSGFSSSNTGSGAGNSGAPVPASDLPAQGGPPPIRHDLPLATLLAGLAVLAAGAMLLRSGFRTSSRDR